MAKRVRKDNLFVLAYANNNCYVTIMELSEYEKMDPSLMLDFRQEGWLNRSFNLTPFGQSRSKNFQKGPAAHSFPCREGIIGIFDRTKIQHLKNMVFAATEATRTRGSFFEID